MSCVPRLARTGVAACADLPARVLSAGQRRRVAMARVLAMRASLWLLDEPLTNLDAAGSELMSELLQTHVAGGGLAWWSPIMNCRSAVLSGIWSSIHDGRRLGGVLADRAA